jgi:hypothetical protein
MTWFDQIPASGQQQQTMSVNKKKLVLGTSIMAVAVMGLSFILIAVALAKSVAKPRSPQLASDDLETIRGCTATVVALAAGGFVVSLVVLFVGHRKIIGHAKRFSRSDQQHYDSMGPRIQRQRGARHQRMRQQLAGA